MAQGLPGVGNVHANRPLTDLSLATFLENDTYIAAQAAPQYASAKQSDIYYVWNRADMLRDVARRRVPGTEANTAGVGLAQQTFTCETYDTAMDVTEEEIGNEDEVLDLVSTANQVVMQRHMIKREVAFVSDLMTAASVVWDNEWTGVANADNDTAAEFTTFLDATNADPIAEIKRGARTVQSNTGFRPNEIIISQDVWDTITEHPNVLDRVTGGSNTAAPGLITRENFAAACGLDRIWVLGCVSNDAGVGATESTDFIAAGTMLLYYRPRTQVVTRNTRAAFICFNWRNVRAGANNLGLAIMQYNTQLQHRGIRVRVEGWQSFKHEIVDSSLAVLYSSCLAAAS